MTDWVFRLRFRVPRTSGLSIYHPWAELEVDPPVGPLRLEVWPRGSGAINEAEWLVLTGSATSEVEAGNRGEAAREALQRSFARLRVAADFGMRAPKSGLADSGKRVAEDASGRPVLDDEHGLMVYPAEPPPRFVSVGAPTIKLSAQLDRLRAAMSAALDQADELTEQERIAYDLFAASFFDSSPDARLISLVTAVETLIDPPQRSSAARAHVESLITATKDAGTLTSRERDSLLGKLGDLRRESISATGREFVGNRLGDRTYGDQPAPRLWRKSYEVRSRLVHGSVPRPLREDVGRCAANLEVMVAHLLSGRLLDVDI